ncbi:MAG: AAA family ATPase, partial [Planctomycetaceae bacterium]|nr:AAA family ATPase [Planctomycetaceae bacterium]
MLIRCLNVAKYGVCRNTEIDDLNGDLVVVYGPNETGKTTCMEFIRGVFYGLANDGREKYVRGHTEDVFGGSISIENGDGQSWVVTRELSTDGVKPREKLDILIGGQLHSVATMNRDLLKGVDHDIFRNVFTVGLDELQHLNSLDATEAAEFIYEMTTGLDRVSLGEVLRGVTQTRSSIFASNYEQSEVSRLQRRVEQLDQLIHYDCHQLDVWSKLRNELRAGLQDIERVAGESRSIQCRIDLFAIATMTRDMWIEKKDIQEQLQSLPDLNEGLAEMVSADSVQRLRDWETERVSLNDETHELSETSALLKSQIDSVSINTDVASNVMRIHTVCEHSSWLASLQDQVASLKEHVAELNNQNRFELSNDLLDRISGSLPEVDQHVLRAVSQAENELAFAEERHAEQTVLVGQIEEEFAEVEQAWMDLVVANAPQLVSEVGKSTVSTGTGFDETEFETLLAELGSDIGVLRTRLALDDRQARLQRELEATESCIANNIGGLPAGGVLVCSAGLTITGFAATAVGFAFPEAFALGSFAATLIGAIGVVCCTAGISYRLWDSLRRKQRATANLSQRTLLKQQNVKCRDDIDAIQSKHDLSGAAWDQQLRELQEQHVKLESMVPVLANLKTANARRQLSRTRLADFQRNADEAQKSWARVLVEQGLPTEMRPSDVHLIADNSEVVAQRKRRLDDRKAELVRREADLSNLVNRIEQLLIDLDIQPESTEAALQIRQLSQLLNGHRGAKQQRKELKKSMRKLKKQRNKLVAKRQKLETSINRVFVRAGVSDLAELEQLSQDHCGVLALKNRCEEASNAIQRQLKGKEFDEHELYSIMDKHSRSELSEEIERFEQQRTNSSELLANLHEEQGRKKLELQQLLNDTSLDSAKLERNVVRKQLEDAQRRWRVWAVTEHVLQQVRDVYESERQPETLIDAGQWLAKISNGKYTRIWTPLDEDALYVDDASGQTWGIDMLSRGTRESVFICLRLALVNSYTSRGVRLPLILDDVLVNCDANRAKHGVAMLRDFAAQGTQVFFFTCHKHLTAKFESANADVRELTLRDDVVAPGIERFSSLSTESVRERVVVQGSSLETVGNQSDELGVAMEEVAEEEVVEEEVVEEEVVEEEVVEEEVVEEEVVEEEVAMEEVAM